MVISAHVPFPPSRECPQIDLRLLSGTVPAGGWWKSKFIGRGLGRPYNSAVDEPPIRCRRRPRSRRLPAEVEEAPQPKTSAPTEVVFEGLASGKEPWRGSGCSSRLPLYGCLFGLVLLIGILFIGTSMMRRTVWVNLEKARRAVVQSLPRDLPAAERQRTIDNLERLRAMLEASKDPYPEMGEFVNRVREVLEDGRFTAEEVGGLNVYIERVIEESGIPPLQLGAEIRNSEFGIRNAVRRPRIRALSRVWRELKTQNSKLKIRMTSRFILKTPFEPAGDQVQAIDRLIEGVEGGVAFQTLLGVTGSGKTFTMAKVVEATNRPTLVLSHNKTLAAQLYQEFKAFFPENAVEYFVSYYDYYQPEAYVAASDTYIEKETSINEEIDRMRLSATRSLFERRDVLIVASVSCIYGLGSPEAYFGMLQLFEKDIEQPMEEVLRQLAKMQYERTHLDLAPGSFRLRGDSLEIYPPYDDSAVRISFWGDQVESIERIDPVRGVAIEELDRLPVYPRTHYVTPRSQLLKAIDGIRAELDPRLAELSDAGKLLEAQRLGQRTMFDLEMLTELGFCSGIENYSRHLTGRAPGEPPPTLLDYFPQDFLCIVDESHVTVPQVRGMFHGDRSRKQNLVEYGFRLPSALDNRPLTFEEFEERIRQVVFVSATPGPYELEHCEGEVVEQLIRPTGLLDPEVEVRPATHQVDDLLAEIRAVVARGERVLVTTLTKRMAEDLSSYLAEVEVRVRYLHSEINTLERSAILADLSRGEFDVLVGINLLREGLDLPEVALVAILDADQEGFLRSETSLIQTIGRAARNVDGRAILYADKETGSMQRALGETRRRRERQAAHNAEHGIEPRTIVKDVASPLLAMSELDYYGPGSRPLRVADGDEDFPNDAVSLNKLITELEKRMRASAKVLEFEEAARLRDRLKELRRQQIYKT